MMQRVWIFRTTVSALLLLIFWGSISAQDTPDSVAQGAKEFRKRVVVSGLQGPWELTWGPDKMLWVTERTGRQISRIDPATGHRHVAITLEEASSVGGPDGVLGMALHPELLKGTGQDYVYVAYSYIDKDRGPHADVVDPASPFRNLYFKIVRLHYNAARETLSEPIDILTGLPAGNDHQGGRLKFGPGQKLYFTIGDQGHNQLGNFCLPNEAQRLPTQAEVNARDYAAYVGKTLRINLDGSIPADNPRLNGVVSHVYTYGHRNPQGLDFAANGILYESEHGPKTDDEINILSSGSNYGWPNIAGFQDNKAYTYVRWVEASVPCSKLTYSETNIPPSVPQSRESDFHKPFVNPIATMFTVPTGYNFSDKACRGVEFVCWPTVAVAGAEYYESKKTGIPGWDHVLLLPTLKRGSLYVLPLTPDGKVAAGHFTRYFASMNRFRDTAVSTDGRTIYIATDPGGVVGSKDGGVTSSIEDPGAILAFTYMGEGTNEGTKRKAESLPRTPTARLDQTSNRAPVVDSVPLQFTTLQAANGEAAYNRACAVCHGTTLTNGTYGTPLAGEYFKSKWFDRRVRDLYQYAQTKMPPSHPGLLPADTYADIVAYILRTNGFKAGDTRLKTASREFENMIIQ